MQENNNKNLAVSLDYSNKQLSELPKELEKYKSTLINLDISANPLLDLDQTIKALTEFTSLKKLKINIETGDEAKKIIDALPLLEILNDHPINEEDNENQNQNENIEIISESHENNETNGNNNINDNLIEEEIAQFNYQSVNNSNGKKNINKIIDNNININTDNNIINQNINNILENKVEINDENKFEFILNKIKEYSEITKEKYDLINNEYNRLVNNNIKNTLDICSFFNKVLINLIKDAQEQNNIKIGSLKPLLEAQSQNEIIRINFEGKMHLALQNSNINNNHSYITIESLREKNKFIQTETNSISQDKNVTNISSNNYNNLNSNLNNNSNNNSVNYTNHSNNKKKYDKNISNISNDSNKKINKNEIRKQYSNNIKNLSHSKIKKRDENDRNNEKNSIGYGKNITFSIDDYLSDKSMIKNKSFNKNENIQQINKKEKKKFKFIQKSHSKKKISNKISFQENTDTYANTYTNVNTEGNNKLNVSQPTAILLNNTNTSFQPLVQTVENQPSYKNRIDNKSYHKKTASDNYKYLGKTLSTISNNNSNNSNYLSKYDMLKDCQDNPTINNLLLQIEKKVENVGVTQIFDGLKDQIYYNYNNIHTINLKNLLEIISQVYRLRANRIKRQMLGTSTNNTKGTLETDLMTFLKSKYGLKKLIVEWNINILSSIKAFSKINGEVCLFGLILRNELDEGSIDILFKIKETVDSILRPLYKYDNEVIINIKNNKEFMKESEWQIIAKILYNNDNNLRQRFQNKIYNFIKKFINNDKILEKNGKKILFGDFLNQLIMFNLRLRKRYLKNLVTFFKKQDKDRYGLINHEEFKLMMENIGIIEKENFKEITDYLIESADKECSGQISFNDVVVCFDNFYLDYQNDDKNEEKIKLLDKINNLNLKQ